MKTMKTGTTVQDGPVYCAGVETSFPKALPILKIRIDGRERRFRHSDLITVEI